MNKIIFIFLSAFLSLTLIFCSKKDDSASSSSSTANTQTFVDANFCRLTKNTSSRNSSLMVNETELNARSSKRTGRVKYVDKSSQSKYKTDNYLLIDPFDSNSVMCERTGTVICDRVDLSDAAPILIILIYIQDRTGSMLEMLQI